AGIAHAAGGAGIGGHARIAHEGHVLATQHRIAAVRSAGVPVVARGRRARLADAGTVAGFVTVADRVVVARAAGGPVGVRAFLARLRRRVAGIGRARVAVVAVGRDARGAGTRAVARLDAVAGVAVRAGRADRQIGEHASGRRVAGVGGAGVAVV